MTDESCAFCNLGERVLRANERAQLVLSNPRKVPGHFLVIPKRHVEKPWELTADELQDIFDLIFFVEQRIVGKLGDGVDIRQNYRPYWPQGRIKMDHIHFHVVPRSDNDYLYQVSEKFERDIFAELDDLERKEVEQLIK